MFKALVIFIVIASILMIGIVLIQKSKGGGLASNYASSNQILGVRKTNSFVEKATWTLAIVICVLSIASAFFISGTKAEQASRTQDVPSQTTAPANFGTPAAKKEAPKTAQAPAAAPAPAQQAPAK